MDRGGRFLVRQWLDGCAIFDRRSGDTHALDPLTAAMFMCWGEEIQERSSLVVKMSSLRPDIALNEIESQFDAIVERLEKLDLLKVGAH
jgi:PqqD family protein of HPr-rel-A system